METLRAILTRRSIRNFLPEGIEEQKVELLLRAAMQAPSAHNKQPWQFVVIMERELLNAIADFHPYAKMLHQAPLALAVCGDLRREKDERYLALNCAAATQNILLAAHNLELGAVWVAIYPRKARIDKIKELLELPQFVLPISLVAVGYPKRSAEPEERYDAKKVHFNTWQRGWPEY